MTTIFTGIASILVVGILIRSGFSGTGTTSISEKITVDRLAVLLPSADQRQTLLGFVFLPWQRLAGFATGVLGLGIPSTAIAFAGFECPVSLAMLS